MLETVAVGERAVAGLVVPDNEKRGVELEFVDPLPVGSAVLVGDINEALGVVADDVVAPCDIDGRKLAD